MMPELGIRRENIVWVSGIGCSSRFPVLHEHLRLSHHPRSRAGVRDGHQARQPGAQRVARHRRRRRPQHRRQSPDAHAAPQRGRQDPALQQPDLRPHQGAVLADERDRQGDEEHARRRHPTLRSTRQSCAIGMPATFVARTVDTDAKHLERRCCSALPSTRAPRSSRSTRTARSSTTPHSTASPQGPIATSTQIRVAHGEPLLFGTEQKKGLRIDPRTLTLKVVTLGEDGVDGKGRAHPRRDETPTLAYMLARMPFPEFPGGGWRALRRRPSHLRRNGSPADDRRQEKARATEYREVAPSRKYLAGLISTRRGDRLPTSSPRRESRNRRCGSGPPCAPGRSGNWRRW